MTRAFFALQPAPAARRELAHRRPSGRGAGRPVPEDNLHVTLAFLGAIDEAAVMRARNAAARVAAVGFSLCFNEVAVWRSGVCVALPETVPEAANQLRGQLARLLREAQVPFDQRIWRPHVTLARRARSGGGGLANPVTAGFDAFVLMQSLPQPEGVRYTVLDRWVLDSHQVGQGWEG